MFRMGLVSRLGANDSFFGPIARFRIGTLLPRYTYNDFSVATTGNATIFCIDDKGVIFASHR